MRPRRAYEGYGDFEQCVKCTICTEYCPVVAVNPLFPGPKQAGPDGERHRIKQKFFFDESLKLCSNCKKCETACPSGVGIADIIHSARMRFEEPGFTLREKMLANTDVMGKLVRPFAPIVNAALKSPAAKTLMHAMFGLHKGRDFPSYSKESFVEWFEANRKATQARYKTQVLYFHGCSTEFQQPWLGKELVDLLNALGCGVQIAQEKCCGVAHIANGLFGTARRHARHNVLSLSGSNIPIITTSPSCSLALKDEYPAILGVDNRKISERISIAEKFIYEYLDYSGARLVFRTNIKARAAYHLPCHMEKLGWGIFSIRLMKKIPGLELKLLDSRCCGISGTYGFKKENYVAAQKIGEPLFQQIKELAPDFVACECETCKWQIEMSTGYKVKNPISLLCEALDLEATAKANENINQQKAQGYLPRVKI